MTARLPDIQAKRNLYSDVVGEPLAEPPGVPEMGQGSAALLVLHPLRKVRHHDLHHQYVQGVHCGLY